LSGRIQIIGIDCAVQAKNIGIAVGEFVDDWVDLQSVNFGLTYPIEFVANAIRDREPTLLALDAPLGWPISMGKVLADHNASERIRVSPNDMFRRETDRFVKLAVGKQSLDVGADRIARTAWAAIDFLGEVRRLTSNHIPLAWEFDMVHESSCIEVYPAATLEAHKLSSRGYKGSKPEHRKAREALLAKLRAILKVDGDKARTMLLNDDAFDAAVCIVAAAEFLRGTAARPENMDVARKESWIWVRSMSD